MGMQYALHFPCKTLGRTMNWHGLGGNTEGDFYGSRMRHARNGNIRLCWSVWPDNSRKINGISFYLLIFIRTGTERGKGWHFILIFSRCAPAFFRAPVLSHWQIGRPNNNRVYMVVFAFFFLRVLGPATVSAANIAYSSTSTRPR